MKTFESFVVESEFSNTRLQQIFPGECRETPAGQRRIAVRSDRGIVYWVKAKPGTFEKASDEESKTSIRAWTKLDLLYSPK